MMREAEEVPLKPEKSLEAAEKTGLVQEDSETSSMGSSLAALGQLHTGDARQCEDFLFWWSISSGAKKLCGNQYLGWTGGHR
jgi:hypothetical protein